MGGGRGGDRHSFAVCCTPPYLQGLELAVSSFVFSTTACETSCAKQSELGKLVTCFAKIRILRNTKYETVNPSASHPPPLTTCFTNTAEGWGGGGQGPHTAYSRVGIPRRRSPRYYNGLTDQRINGLRMNPLSNGLFLHFG